MGHSLVGAVKVDGLLLIPSLVYQLAVTRRASRPRGDGAREGSTLAADSSYRRTAQATHPPGTIALDVV